MSPIEKYIHRATIGLPEDERLEAAAELRSTLLEFVRIAQAQGMQREEAEHMVVRKMGPPTIMNRRLLGHIFTHRLGWQVVSILLALVAIWLASDLWLRPQQVQQIPVNLISVDTMFINPTRFVIDLPHDVGNVFFGYNYHSGRGTLLAMKPDPDRNAGTRLELLRPQLEIVTGEFPRADRRCTSRRTPAASLQLLSGQLGGQLRRSSICAPVPFGYVPGSWESLESSISTDQWVPVAVFKPLVEERRGNPGDLSDAYSVERIAPEERWLVVSVWAGRDMKEPVEGVWPPGVRWLRDRHPGVFVELDEQEGRR